MNTDNCPCRRCGFSLVELLAAIAVLGLLTALIIPLSQSVRTRAAKVKDVAQLREYGLAVLSYATTNRTVAAADLLDEETMAEYVGDENTFSSLLSSPYWSDVNGLGDYENPRSFTLNSTLFRRDPMPDSPGHAIVPTEVFLIQNEQNRPLLFTGISQPGRNRAYSWGGSAHLNPVYGGMNRTSPGNIEFEQHGEFSVLTLLVGGGVEFIDYAQSNDPSWWNRDHLE